MDKLTNKTKCLIKDLELQIDFLVGYKPTSCHWKMEYHVRKKIIEETLASENTPQEIIDKIARIQDVIYRLRNGDKHEQDYINESMLDYEKQHNPIKVTHKTSDGVKEWYI